VRLIQYCRIPISTLSAIDVYPLDQSRPYESGGLWSCGSSLLSCLQGRTPLDGRVRLVDAAERSSYDSATSFSHGDPGLMVAVLTLPVASHQCLKPAHCIPGRCQSGCTPMLARGWRAPGALPSRPWPCSACPAGWPTEAAVLLDHVQEPEPAAIGRGIEVEVHAPTWLRCSARCRRIEPTAGLARLRLRGEGRCRPSSRQSAACACRSWSSPRAAAGDRPSAGPSGCASQREVRFAAQRRSCRDDV
jgi:hypothetical protein